jgi:hypothetical protein
MKTCHPALQIVPCLAVLALSGCVSARYQPAAKNTPPATVLNLSATQPPVEATVNSVIVYRGPGSWKRDAFWDEYVVSIVNCDAVPVNLESAALTDFRGDATGPGDNPWTLERQSRTRAEELNRVAKAALVQLGAGYLTVGVVGGVMFTAGTACATAGAVIWAGAIPAYAVAAVVRNYNHRHDIEAEFTRRRLVLPATIAPGQTAQGSLFFRISPGPQRLMLRGRTGDAPVEIAVDLAPLKGLHLKTPPAEPIPPKA